MSKFCTQCGLRMNEGFKFCGSCGAKVVSPIAVDNLIPISKSEKSPFSQNSKKEDVVSRKNDSSEERSKFSDSNRTRSHSVISRPTPDSSNQKEEETPPPKTRERAFTLFSSKKSEEKTEKVSPSQTSKLSSSERTVSTSTFWSSSKGFAASKESSKPVARWNDPESLEAVRIAKKLKQEEDERIELKKIEDKKRLAKEKEKEEQYIQNKETSKQIKDYKERKKRISMLSKIVDFATCDCSMVSPSFEIKTKGERPDIVLFRIDVVFDGVSWVCFRSFKQFKMLDEYFKKEIKGYVASLPTISAKDKFDLIFNEERRRGLNIYLQIIHKSRGAIVEAKYSSIQFFRFIAPTQLGDIKPPNGIIPFKIDVNTKKKQNPQ